MMKTLLIALGLSLGLVAIGDSISDASATAWHVGASFGP
jgi:hypothetical protein